MRFAGLAQFRTALLDFLHTAASEHWPQLLLCDPDFSLWPWSDTDILAALENWSHRPYQLTIIAADYSHIERNFPRFIQWRRQWDHIVRAHAPAPIHSGSLPRCILAAPHRALQILDPVRCRGIALHEPLMLRQLQEVVDEVLLKARPAFPASTTGL
jgi:hypothetical protein